MVKILKILCDPHIGMMLDAGFWPPARRAYRACASERYWNLKDNHPYFIEHPVSRIQYLSACCANAKLKYFFIFGLAPASPKIRCLYVFT